MNIFSAGQKIEASKVNENFVEATKFIPGGMLGMTRYTDDINNIGSISAASGATIYLSVGSPNYTTNPKYLNGVAQSITAATLVPSATYCYGAIVSGGYIYVAIYKSPDFKIFRCSVNDNIADAGNWTLMTISGWTWPAVDTFLAGVGGGYFWITKNGVAYQSFTLSGTTLTYVGDVTVTGSNHGTNAVVNDNGIYASFSSAPEIRKASHAGVLDASKTYKALNRPFATKTLFCQACADASGQMSGYIGNGA